MANTIQLTLLLYSICVVPTLAGVPEGPIDFTSDQFPYHEILDANFELKWNFNSSHIVFETLVKTNGYIGFGISDHGAMYPSDVIVGWVSNGHAHFSDRHAIGHSTPVTDAKQDWHLLGANETGDYTRLTMVRKLDTCDSDDMPIKEGTTRVIYSYGPVDPTSDSQIPNHGAQRRGTKSMLLLDPPTQERGSAPLPSDVTTMDFLNKNFSVPGKQTFYSCTTWKLPKLDGKHHIVRFEPVIQAGHERLAHHILLYSCRDALSDSFVGTQFECHRDIPDEAKTCDHVFIAWAIGGTGFDFPAHTGQSLGTSLDPVYFMMETHYDNPAMRSDFVDNSGIRLYLTKQLRQYDAGILEAGVHVDPYQIIPPYNKHFLSQGFCHYGCLSEALATQDMHVFANLLHAHLMGVRLRTRVMRNGTELPPLQEDNNYDFDYQEQRMLPQERVIKKGDAFIIECEYDSSQRTKVTYGGLSSKEEMCLSFILYYPRSALTGCWSRTNFDIPPDYAGQNVFQVTESLDWTNHAVQQGFADVYRKSPEYYVCQGDRQDFKFNLALEPKLNVTKPYIPPKTCP